MALKDRDYMKRWGRDDPYHNQLDLGPQTLGDLWPAGSASAAATGASGYGGGSPFRCSSR